MVTAEQLRKAAEDYERDGFAVIENFLSQEEIDAIKNETIDVVREQYSSKGDKLDDADEIWEAPDKNRRYGACKDGETRFFFEPHAVDKDNLKLLTKPENALCKVGFSLHRRRKLFLDSVKSDKVQQTFKALDFINPMLIQTMVNFKNPRVGGEFIPHQDTSYLTTTRPEWVVGFWFALDDATVENGSVEVIPGSHKWSLVRKYVRRDQPAENGNLFEWTGPMAIYDQKMYKILPAKKGSLVLIHGLLLHKSEPNRTDQARWAYVFHAFDSGRCNWVDGWLSARCPAFEPIYTQ